ncbi:hypothetical protein [Wenyingzhuangia sp. IMCC45574]
MHTPIKLHSCASNLEAFQLKNILQRNCTICVDIQKVNHQYVLFVSESNYNKATIILQNQLEMEEEMQLENTSPYLPTPTISNQEKTPKKNIAWFFKIFLRSAS